MNSPKSLRLLRIGRVLAEATVTLACLVLIGWWADVAVLRSIVPGLTSMNPMTSLCFIMLGVSLYLRTSSERRERLFLSHLLASLVVTVAVIQLSGYFLDKEIGLDHLLFQDQIFAHPGPTGINHMSQMSAVCFLLSGISLLGIGGATRRRTIPAQYLLIPVVLISLLSLTPYFYRMLPGQTVPTFLPMALHTAVAFIMLSLAMLFSRPADGWMKVIMSETVGGILVRRFLPGSIFIPLLLGWFRVLGERAGLYDHEMGLALLVVCTIALLLFMSWRVTGHLYGLDLKRKTAVDALSISEERYRSLTKATSQIVWTTNPAGEVEDMPEWRDYTGQSLEEVRGMGWTNAVHPEDREKTAAAWRNAVESKSYYEVVYRIRKRNGDYGTVIARGIPVLEPDGSIREWVGTCADISEQVQAEQRLQTSQALYHSLVETLPLYVFRKDLRGRFTYGNGRFCQIVNKSLDEIVGRTDFHYFPPELAAKYQADDCRVMETGEPFQAIEEHDTPEGDKRYVEIWKAPFYDADNNLLGLQGMFLNVTDRLQAEQDLKKTAAELERSNAELQLFAYIASHDLQEPLRMVTSFVQLLSQRYKDKLDDKAGQYINFAVDGATRMQRLINDLLAYSRVGTQGREFRSTDCEKVLGDVLSVLQMAIGESGGQVTHDPMPVVSGDEIQLGQLFQNLIGNALKFKGESAPAVHVGVKPEDDHWLFSVKDNGIGIDMQFHERIFVIFQRLHPRDHYPGTGIGLAICKKIVERHGGQIWVESAPGEGTTFYFTIPTVQTAQVS